MRKLLMITVFIAGMTSLAVEMAASYLLENYFGTSNIIWATIIGLILIYLTLGYFIGGAWADKSPQYKTLFSILTWAGFTIGLMPLVSRPILRLAASAFDALNFGNLIGAFIVTMVLFIVPITLLGTASPFAIRLGIDDPANAGKVSGRIYAISTLGSFIGTFIPGLILVPLIGTYRTFLVFSSILLVTALIGLWKTTGIKSALKYIWMPVIIAGLFIWGVRGPNKTSEGMIYETESSYNYIQVIEQDSYRMLRLNEGQGVHSIYHPTQLAYTGPWDQVLVAPFYNPAPINPASVQKMAIVGLAAGTTARQASAVFPNIQIDGYEIDPKIVDVARTYFDMNMPNLTVYEEDGRWGLNRSTQKYQVISIDAYRPPYIPWHLTTQEFFQMVRDHLTEDGVMVINIGRSQTDRSLVDSFSTTILSVFPTVHVMDIPNSFNTILFATAQPTPIDNLVSNYWALKNNPQTPPLLLSSIETNLTNLAPQPQSTGVVFTDDRAPIEFLTNQLMVEFFLSGEVDNLQ